MRINFLSIIACILFVSVAVSSCLDSEDTFVASSDATVRAFGLDTIHGKHYKFAIDQINRQIYNLEPLPVGSDTLIDSIRIDTFQVSGYITAGLLGKDTIVNLNNHQNLTSASNIYRGGDIRPTGDFLNGIKYKILAADMSTSLEYTLHISIYEHDPDSIRWQQLDTPGLPETSIAHQQTAVTLNDRILLYIKEVDGVSLYQNGIYVPQAGKSTDGQAYSNWSKSALQGIHLTEVPAVVKLNVWNAPKAQTTESLYTVTEGKLYKSINGLEWETSEDFNTTLPQGYTLKKLMGGFNGTLLGLLEQEGKAYSITSNGELTAWKPESIYELPEKFPTENLYTAEYQTTNFLPQVMVVGKVAAEDEKIIPWAYDGASWTLLDPSTEYKSYCLTEKIGYQPAVMNYDGTCYIFGEKLDFIYSSKNHLAWYEASKKFFLPKEAAKRENYSMTIDNEQYIWLISGGTSNNGQQNNAIWRGRLNRIGYQK